jgi:hypothetical protein
MITAGATVTCLTLTSTLVAGAGTLNVLIPTSGGTQATVLYPTGIIVAPSGSLTINNSALVIGDVTVGAGGTFTINGDCEVTGAFNAAADGVTVTIKGDCQIAGALSVGGGTSGTMTVKGKLEVSAMVTLVAHSHLAVSGEWMHCDSLSAAADGVFLVVGTGDFRSGDSALGGGTSGTLIIGGTAEITDISFGAGASFTASNVIGSSTYILGANVSFTCLSLQCGGNFTAAADGVLITINGDCQIAGALTLGAGASGTMTVDGHFAAAGGYTLAAGATLTWVLGTQPEKAVNLSVDNTGEDVFNLATAGLHYAVKSLWLNFTDPVAAHYTVDLHQLINLVPTIVDTVTINTPGGFYNLMDLFGLPALAGDNLEVKVTLSVPGPLAVTGSYVYEVE